MSEETLKQFVSAAYNLLDISSITLVGCVVDKLAIQLHYHTPWYAPAIAYDFLMQRVQFEMQEKNAIAHITIDDMRGATPKGNEFKNLLRRQHERLLSSGTPLQKHIAFDRIKTLKFTDSKASDLIQLADLVAYSVYRIDFVNVYLNGASKLLVRHHETLAVLLKYRRGDEQRVHVEHVHIHNGGQAIVRNIEVGRGAKQKTEEGPHAKV